MHTGGRHKRFQITHGATHGLPDAEAFLALLDSLDSLPVRAARELFDDSSELFIARAPGRLDLMGGIADYSGSLVLEWPLAEATFAAVQRDPVRSIRIVSLAPDTTRAAAFSTTCEAAFGTTREAAFGATREAAFEMSLDDFYARTGDPVDYDAARALFDADGARGWAAYVAGAFPVLMRERGVRFDAGARILIASNVPEGKGVSSSAALEVTSMSALAAAFGIEIAPRDLALLCRKVENEVVGAPCGVMDQMTSACGVSGQLLALLCQPAEIQETISLPPELAVWGLDSGVRHSVRGDAYESVRVGAFMGYRIIAAAAGLKVEVDGGGRARVADEKWRGYLSNLTPSEFETSFAPHLPEHIAGDEFLARYGGTTDTVTRVAARRTYAVLKPTAHAVYEHFRVRAFAALLRAPRTALRDEAFGELMYQSHAGYAACGLDSAATAMLVGLAREVGAAGGIYGAKITGGGSGGTVAVLGARDCGAAIKHVAARYRAATGHEPYIFAGSSPGCAAFGGLRASRRASAS